MSLNKHSQSAEPSKPTNRQLHGVLFGAGAYGLWGLMPLYFKWVAHVPPAETLAYRAFWSFVVLAVLSWAFQRWGTLRQGLRSPRTAIMLGCSAVLIATNWLAFIYAVTTGQVLQASLGYFVTPLFSVALGVILLGEHLRALQMVALALAAIGGIVFATLVGTFPWIAVLLAVSFGLYGLLRKTTPVDGLSSLTAETLALAPLALLYLGYLHATGQLTATDLPTFGKLSLSGAVTAAPLLLFGAAAHRLQLSTVGFMQYLTPTCQFSIAVFVFGEAFADAQLISFAFIWAAVAVYIADSAFAARRRMEIVEPFGADEC